MRIGPRSAKDISSVGSKLTVSAMRAYFCPWTQESSQCPPQMSNCISIFSVGQIDSGKRNIRSRQWAVAGMVSLLMVQMASAVVVEFTTAEGYTSGTLNNKPTGQVMWLTSSGNSSFTVNPSGEGSVQLSTSASGGVAVYQNPIDFTTGIAYTSYIDFSFTQSVADIPSGPSSSTTMLNNLYLTNTNGGTVSASQGGFGRTAGTDAYRLAFAGGAFSIDGLSLGINSGAGDTTSDVIRMVLTIQQGATASSWIGTETIFNVTTGMTLATRSVSNLNFGAAASDTSLYNGIGIGGEMPASGVSALTVLAYSSPAAVPEPATWALLIGGALFLVLRRARQRA